MSKVPEIHTRWLTKKQACIYLSIGSTTTFDKKVSEGVLHKPYLTLGKNNPRWDRYKLDDDIEKYYSTQEE